MNICLISEYLKEKLNNFLYQEIFHPRISKLFSWKIKRRKKTNHEIFERVGRDTTNETQ